MRGAVLLGASPYHLLGSSGDPLPAFVCGGFALLIIAIVIAALREAISMKSWPVAKGSVLESKVEGYRQSAGSSGTFASSPARMTLYRPVVRYEYEVDGKRFRGDQIAQSPGWNRAVPEFAEKIVQRYPTGSDIDVHYNPKRHDQAVLEPRVPRSWILALLIAVALLGVAVHIYFR
ncbi:MAG: DUF3592 domain-containing protein [Chthoniobacterales bacterium]